MPEKRKTFSRAFKQEAVRLLEHGDKPPADIAAPLTNLLALAVFYGTVVPHLSAPKRQ